jgi:hypothetical protein
MHFNLQEPTKFMRPGSADGGGSTTTTATTGGRNNKNQGRSPLRGCGLRVAAPEIFNQGDSGFPHLMRGLGKLDRNFKLPESIFVNRVLPILFR